MIVFAAVADKGSEHSAKRVILMAVCTNFFIGAFLGFTSYPYRVACAHLCQ